MTPWGPPPPTWVLRASWFACEAVYGRLYGCRFSGLEHVPSTGRVIVAVNHVSIWDPPMVSWALSRRRWPWFPGKEVVFRKPILGSYLRAVQAFPLDRSRGDVGAMRKALELLESEQCLAIYPEGTRGMGRTLPAKPGVGYLAAQTGAPVVPAFIGGMFHDHWTKPLSFTAGPALRFGDGGEARDKDGYRAFAERVLERIRSLGTVVPDEAASVYGRL